MTYNYNDIVKDFLNGKAETTKKNNYTERLFITDKKLYSYGYHFLLGKFLTLRSGLKLLLVNNNDYSITTKKHKNILVNNTYDDVVYLLDCDERETEYMLNKNKRAIKNLKEKITRQRKEHTKQRSLNEITFLQEQNHLLRKIIKEQRQDEIVRGL